MEISLHDLRRRCGAALAASPRELREAQAQDLLDILAVARGIKPMAVAGYGFDSAGFRQSASRLASEAGLAGVEGRPWLGVSQDSGPDWYRESLRGDDAAVLFVGPAGSEARLRRLVGARLTLAEEAGALGYPSCCVMEFHRRQRLFHLISRRMIKRQANGDRDLLQRLARAQVMLAPKSEIDSKLLMRATRAVFAPLTSIAMCAACEAGTDSPARLISADFARLAEAANFSSWLNSAR